MLTANTNRKFTHPSLLKRNVRGLSFDGVETKNRQLANTPDRAIERLVEGNHKFVEGHEHDQTNSVRLSAVAKGQTPFAAVLNYAQINTSIEELFGQKFGELFVINSPGQMTNAQEISGIEYGVLILGISVVIVLGDTTEAEPDCQTSQRMKVAIEHNKILISKSAPWKSATIRPDAQTNILDRVAKLSATPLLARLIQAGDLKIVGGLYDPTQGTVAILD